MKILKIIGLVIVGIIALLLVTALFVKREYGVKREIVINKPSQQVFDYVKFLKNQDNFSVWAMRDPAMKKGFKGKDGTVGAVASWDSQEKHVGKGEQEITSIEEGKRLDFELRFYEPFEAKDHAYMSTEALDSTQTKVTWGFDGKMPYPMNLMLLCMNMDEMLGKDLQDGLNNLKPILEKK
ncbi:MAG TPA: SRPBCC family protein [Cytophagaceae bacterium]|jgi:hypothetical protein|nr:SRPBCC family protein [Cytophagaceae bacterium]